MLKIQVLGSGFIPRRGVLAPLKTPIFADINEIALMMRTPGLKLTYQNPDTGEFVPLTNVNLRHVWNMYGHMKPHQYQKTSIIKNPIPQEPVIETPTGVPTPPEIVVEEKPPVDEKMIEVKIEFDDVPIIEDSLVVEEDISVETTTSLNDDVKIDTKKEEKKEETFTPKYNNKKKK